MFLSTCNFHLYSHFFKAEEQCQSLKEFYQAKIPQKQEDDAESKHQFDSAEKQWQLFLRKSFLTQDLGLEFLNLINMVRMTLNVSIRITVKVKIINSSATVW